MLENNLNSLKFVVFDIETTGLRPWEEQIIEIGAIKIDSLGNVIDKFHEFISLYKVDHLSEFIINLTSITDELLQKEGKNLHEVMQKFADFVENDILVAQNAKFDMSFIDYYYLQNQKFLDNLVIDTIDLAKIIYPDKNTYKLASLVEYFDVLYDSGAHHRADYDAAITSEVLVKELDYLKKNKNIDKLNDDILMFNLEEATLKQKKFLFHLLDKNLICVENKCYLSKNSASRKIELLTYINKGQNHERL